MDDYALDIDAVEANLRLSYSKGYLADVMDGALALCRALRSSDEMIETLADGLDAAEKSAVHDRETIAALRLGIDARVRTVMQERDDAGEIAASLRDALRDRDATIAKLTAEIEATRARRPEKVRVVMLDGVDRTGINGLDIHRLTSIIENDRRFDNAILLDTTERVPPLPKLDPSMLALPEFPSPPNRAERRSEKKRAKKPFSRSQ